jgi:YfiH family protein
LDPLAIATVPRLAEIPGLVHGFERSPPRESREDGRERVRRSLRADGHLFFLKQVHGARIVHGPWGEPPEADGALATEGGVLLAIETADCLPVFLVDPRWGRVAAVHAGWRGTAKGIVREAVSALATAGSRPGDLEAALGPAIGVCCYEVGDEVRAAVDAPGCYSPGPRGRLHFDLRRANRLQLEACGVRSIAEVDDCTFCRADLYPSFRRDGKGSGRIVSFVGFRSEHGVHGAEGGV